MTDNQRGLLDSLVACGEGKGLLLSAGDRRIAETCIRNDWVEWRGAGGIRVYLITKAGREAVAVAVAVAKAKEPE